MSQTDHDVQNTRIPQPIRIVQTALISPRLRMPNRNFCKQMTSTRAIFESKKLKSTCSFLKQLKEKLENDSTTELQQKHSSLVDVINTLSDVNDAISSILSSTSTALSLKNESVIQAKEFDNAMNATNKIYEVTKRIQHEIDSDFSLCYFSKQIIASNYDQIITFKENLNTIGNRIYVDKELVNQLGELQILLKDTILKLKQREQGFNSEGEKSLSSELKSLKQSQIGRLVKIEPSLESELMKQKESMISGDTALSSEFSSIGNPNLEEIKGKPENKRYFMNCMKYLDLLKVRLQKVMVGESCEYGEVKVYKDKQSRPFDELRLNVDDTALLIQVERVSSHISRLILEDEQDKPISKSIAEKIRSDKNISEKQEKPLIDNLKEERVPAKLKEKSLSDKRKLSGDKSKERLMLDETKKMPTLYVPNEKPTSYKKEKHPSYISTKYSKLKQPHQFPEHLSRPGIPYTAEKRSLPVVGDEEMYSSRDLDVKQKERTRPDYKGKLVPDEHEKYISDKKVKSIAEKPRSDKSVSEREEKLSVDKLKEKPMSDKPKEKLLSDKKELSLDESDQKLVPEEPKKKATPNKSIEKPILDETKKTPTLYAPKDKSALYKKEKQAPHVSKLNCCKRRKYPKLKSPHQISKQVSRADIPYTAAKKSLPIVADEQVCSSRDLDVKTEKSTLRKLGINHPDTKVTNTLKQIPVDYLLMSCRPAKCCRKVVLNETPRAKYPYAASLRSLPLVQKDLDKIKELVQSNVNFLDSCTTFDAYINFQKRASDKLLYFCNAPILIEVRFFEIFKREFSKASVAKSSKVKTTQSNYEIRILEFLRKFYTRQPLPQKTEEGSKKRKNKEDIHSKKCTRSRNKKKKKESTIKAIMTPRISLSSSSFISSRFTIASKEEKSKANYSFLLVPKTKVTSYVSEEVTTYKRTQSRPIDDGDLEEETTTTSDFLENVKTQPDLQTGFDESSLSPANYAETLNAIYELDEHGNVRPKSKPVCPHKKEVTTQHQDDYVEVARKFNHHLIEAQDHWKSESEENESIKSDPAAVPVIGAEDLPQFTSEENVCKYKVSATNVIGPEVIGNLGIRNCPEKILKAVEPNLCTIYEVEENKRSEAGDEIYQQRCDMCQKLMDQNFSDESIIRCNHQIRGSASECDSMNRMRLSEEKRKQILISNESNSPRYMKSMIQNNSTENAPILQMNLNEVIHRLNYQNIYRVNTSQTQTIGRNIDISSRPIFQTNALTRTNQMSVQTSQTDMIEKEMPMYLGPSSQTQNSVELAVSLYSPTLVSKKTTVLSENIRENMVEMKNKQTESIIHQLKVNRSYMVKKNRCLDRIQIEKNVLAYVIHPKKMKNRKEQAEPKYFASAVKGGRIKGFKKTSFESVNSLKRVNHNMESKCEMVCSWPPKQPKVMYRTPRKALFISIHGEEEQQKDKLPVKSSTEASEKGNSQHSDIGSQEKNITPTKTERNKRTKKEPVKSFSNQNYIIGFVGSDGEGERKVPKCNHRHRKEKLKRKKLKRIPEVIDVTTTKHVKRSMLEIRAINDQNIPGFVTVLSTPCDCPDVTIFIPCFCGNYKCDKRKVSRCTRNKTADYMMVPLTNQGSVCSSE